MYDIKIASLALSIINRIEVKKKRKNSLQFLSKISFRVPFLGIDYPKTRFTRSVLIVVN